MSVVATIIIPYRDYNQSGIEEKWCANSAGLSSTSWSTKILPCTIPEIQQEVGHFEINFFFWPYIGTLCVLALQTLHRWRLNFIVRILPWNRNVLIDKWCSTLTKMGKLVRSCKHSWVWQNGPTKPPTKILTKYLCGTFHLGVQKGMCILYRTERKPLGAIL